jgi:hypothetical protein
MTITAIAYQTLLQRSAKYEWNELTSSGERYLPSIKTFPDNYIGVHANGEISANLTEVVQKYIAEILPTTYFDPQCSCLDSCTGTVPSVGLNVQNTTEYSSVYLKNETLSGIEIFWTSFGIYDQGNVSLFEMIVKYVNGVDSSCLANITTATYTFQAGWVMYPFSIRNTTVGADLTKIATGFQPVTYPGDSPNAAELTSAGPLMGIGYVAGEYFLSNATLYWDSEIQAFSKHVNGTLALQWYDYDYNDSGCLNLRYVDPTNMLSNVFQEILLWASLDAANKTEAFVEAYPVTILTYTLLYVTFYPFLAVTTLILAIAFVAVASTLWGWWELGRNVSLSPLETAKAFGAHLFQAENFDMDSKHLANNTGGEEIQVRRSRCFGCVWT